jgi:ADP-ribose pyrophosphatase
VPRHEAAAWLLERIRAGYSIDPKMFAGLYMLENEALFVAPA